jgi:hypothetical protein
MDAIQLIVSILSGGLAGGCVSAAANRMFHWRSLRAAFYPKLEDVIGSYVAQFVRWGQNHVYSADDKHKSEDDENFFRLRDTFVKEMRSFFELKEVRTLASAFKANLPKVSPAGVFPEWKISLDPEFQALMKCSHRLKNKIGLG